MGNKEKRKEWKRRGPSAVRRALEAAFEKHSYRDAPIGRLGGVMPYQRLPDPPQWFPVRDGERWREIKNLVLADSKATANMRLYLRARKLGPVEGLKLLVPAEAIEAGLRKRQQAKGGKKTAALNQWDAAHRANKIIDAATALLDAGKRKHEISGVLELKRLGSRALISEVLRFHPSGAWRKKAKGR